MPAPSSRGNPLSKVSLPIETPRLLLRLPSARDVPDLKRSFRDPKAARAAGAYLHSSAERRDPAAMVTRTLREYRAAEHLSLSVITKMEGSCIGRVGLRGLDWNWKKVESLSYWIDPKNWNQGYATEASWALCHAAFEELDMRRVASQALDRNSTSQAVLRRLGFMEEGRERQALCVRGRCMDMVLFGLLRGELRPVTWETKPRGPSEASARRAVRAPLAHEGPIQRTRPGGRETFERVVATLGQRLCGDPVR